MTSKRSNIVISGPASNEKQTNVRVVIRVRPENRHEAESGSRNIIEVLDDHVLVFDPKEQTSPQYYHGRKVRRRNILVRKNKDLRFAFDRVFDGSASQQNVYESTTKPVIDGLMNGYNCSVFAYGATGAGKTFTMLGDPNSPGVIFLTMMELYHRIEQVQSEKLCDIAISYLEIYNETIRDLLVPSGALAVREDPQKGVCVTGLSVHKPQTAEELISMLEFGNKNRTQHPTDANAESSRSHAVFQVFVRQKNRTANLNTDVKIGKMSLIDLAGSERAIVTRNRGARFQEGANINKSLLALGSCINALANNKKDQFVPYRNSKLTRLLKDSLGGNCRTVMIAAISPSSLTYDDTYNTLRYADRAKNIKSQVKSNVVNVNFHVTQYTKIIADLRLEVTELKARLSQQSSSSDSGNHSENEGRVCKIKADHPSQEDIMKYHSVLYNIFTQRASVRKELMVLESSDRDLSLKISRKNITIERLRLIYGNQSQGDKTMSKFQRTVAASEARHARVRKRKIDVDNRMEKNEEWLQNTLTEMSSLGNGKIPEVLQLTLRTRHLEIEVKDLQRQVTHLKKFARQQDNYMQSSERLMSTLLSTVRKQFYLLKGSNIATSDTITEFENIQKMVEGDREVIWADQNTTEQDSSANVNNLLELPVLSCVRTTPDAPTSATESNAKLASVKNSSTTPHRPKAARSLSCTITNSHTTPQHPPQRVITDGMTTHLQTTSSQSALPSSHSKQPSSSALRESQVDVCTPHKRLADVIGSPMRVCTPHKKTAFMGAPMRVCTPHNGSREHHQSSTMNMDNNVATDHQSNMFSGTYTIKTLDEQQQENSRGHHPASAKSPGNMNSSFTMEGISLLNVSPVSTNQVALLDTPNVGGDTNSNELNNQTITLNDLKESENITKTPNALNSGRKRDGTGQILSYAEVASTPKQTSAHGSRLPLTDIAVNSPQQPVNNPTKTKPFQQKTRNRAFMTGKGSVRHNSTAAAVRSLGLPSMSDRIQAKKRPAPAYMTMTTAAKNKRINTQHIRSSTVDAKQSRVPFSALPSRVRNSRAVPSRNVSLVRTKSMNSLRSAWQS
ncbi:kinesin-like protein KIF18A [Anneissia japonica]|uniref:kinesin-like protein KIF18A n=1 Tax=Anneissia japonica TaxID=1529436 RepID=UPI0014259E96|nr:kinesin-like protein KIF18A [Anneissia japonica]